MRKDGQFHKMTKFIERFKGRISLINKEGSIVPKESLPIKKKDFDQWADPSSFKLSYGINKNESSPFIWMNTSQTIPIKFLKRSSSNFAIINEEDNRKQRNAIWKTNESVNSIFKRKLRKKGRNSESYNSSYYMKIGIINPELKLPNISKNHYYQNLTSLHGKYHKYKQEFRKSDMIEREYLQENTEQSQEQGNEYCEEDIHDNSDSLKRKIILKKILQRKNMFSKINLLSLNSSESKNMIQRKLLKKSKVNLNKNKNKVNITAS